MEIGEWREEKGRNTTLVGMATTTSPTLLAPHRPVSIQLLIYERQGENGVEDGF